MSEFRSLVTYFNFDCFGFYRIRQGKVGEYQNGTIEEIFSDLENWLKGKNLKDTLAHDPDTISRNKSTYCRSFEKNQTTGDIVMTLWKAVGTKNGGVGGAFADESLSSGSKATLKTGTEVDGKEIIWGQPAYYWIIPEYNKVASIRVPNSLVDTSAFCQYIKSYVDYRRTSTNKKETPRVFVHPKTQKEIKTRTVTYQAENDKEKFSLTFKVLARQYKKSTSSVDLEMICRDVTHIVYRESIMKSVPDTRKEWVKLFDKIGSLMGVDVEEPETSEINNIELIIEAKPSPEKLQVMLDEYAEEYTDDIEWCNVGLKRDGRSGRTTWLNEFVVTDEIYLPFTDNDYYDSKDILSVLNQHRVRLVSSLNAVEPEVVNSESESESEQAVETGDELAIIN